MKDALRTTHAAALSGRGQPAVLIAGATKSQAERSCRRAGLRPVVLLDKADLTRDLIGLRRRLAGLAADIVAIHTADWNRQSLQPLFELASLMVPASERVVVVGNGTSSFAISRLALAARLTMFPGAGLLAAKAVRSERHRFRTVVERAPVLEKPIDLGKGSVVMVWRGDPASSTGGAVTHAAGMVGALRRFGMRVGLLTMCEPPPQLQEVIDDLEVASPLPRSARLTREVEDICVNRPMAAAGRRMLQRLDPAFVYQRYDAFMTCGMELAAEHRIPLVLEWNGSAVWARQHWRAQHRVKQVFDPFLRTVERASLQRAVLVRAVSQRAAEMALECGAPANRVVAVSNGVDLTSIPRPSTEPPCNPRPLVGWVGSFGPWHGAPVLIQALGRLPDVCAVLIGEGAQQGECLALACELGVQDRIEWTGALSHAEVTGRLRECDVLASPHVPSEGRPFFGSPTKVFEFMAIGRPVVASALEQIGDILEHGKTAYLVRPGDPDDLARGIHAVLSRPDRGVALGLAARAEVESRHTWDHRAHQLLKHTAAMTHAYPARAQTPEKSTAA